MSENYSVEEQANLGYDADVYDDAELEALEAMDETDEGMGEEAVNETGDVTRADAEDEETELQEEEDEEAEEDQLIEEESEHQEDLSEEDPDERLFSQNDINKIVGKKTRRKIQEVHDSYQPYVQMANQLKGMFPGMSMEEIQEAMEQNAAAAEEAAVRTIMEEDEVSERVARSIYRTERPIAPQVSMPPSESQDMNYAMMVDRIVQEAQEITEDNPDFDVATFMEENPDAAREIMGGRWLRDIVKEKELEKRLEAEYQRGRKDAFKAKQKANKAPKPIKASAGKQNIEGGYLSDKDMKELDAMADSGALSDEAIAARLGF